MFGVALKKFDIYKKLPSDLTEPTLSGAIISIVAASIMLILFLSELHGYFRIDESSEMFIDNKTSKSEKIQINIDLVFKAFPCDVFSIDNQDIMGNEEENI